MNKYKAIKNHKDREFRRITGVKRETFDKMVEILKAAYEAKHMRRGRKAKLCIEDMLLATLEYFHESRTFAEIAASYGIHESNAHRTIRWVEDILIEDGTCALPKRREASKGSTMHILVLADERE